jgi:hypothetical protein
VLVDAENVRRSRWPNVPLGELQERCLDWAARNGADVEVVLEPADDRIAARAAALARAGTPYWLVTSDRGLRARAGASAERVIGGGTFVRELTE